MNDKTAKALTRETQLQVYYKDTRVNRNRPEQSKSDEQKEAKKTRDKENKKRKRAEEPEVRTDEAKAKRKEGFREARDDKKTQTIQKQQKELKRPRAPLVERAGLLKRANHSSVKNFFDGEGESERLQDMNLTRLGVVVTASEMVNLGRRAHKAPGDTTRGSGKKQNGRKALVQLLHDTSHDVSQVILSSSHPLHL